MGSINRLAVQNLSADLLGIQTQLNTLSKALLTVASTLSAKSAEQKPAEKKPAALTGLPSMGLPGLSGTSDLTLSTGFSGFSGMSGLPPFLSGLGLDNLASLSSPAALDPTQFMGGSNLDVFNFTTMAVNATKVHALAGQQLMLQAEMNGNTIDAQMQKLTAAMGNKPNAFLPPDETSGEAPAVEAEASNTPPADSGGGLTGQALKGNMGQPLDGVKPGSRGFGNRPHPIHGGVKMHHGQDYGAPSGTPIRATADGTIKFAGDSGGYGNLVKIDHGGSVETRYAHMSRIKAANGQRVKKGDIIGYVGSTGDSTGPHLHFEVRVNGASQNPLNWLAA